MMRDILIGRQADGVVPYAGVHVGARQSPGWFWEVDEAGRLTQLCSSVSDLLGADHKRLLGQPIWSFCRPVAPEDADARPIGSLGGAHIAVESVCGAARHFRLAIIAGAGGEGPCRGFAVAVTAAQRQLPRRPARPAPRDLGVDLRAPLQQILEAASRMAEASRGPLQPTYIDYARDIARASRHMSGLLRDLGELSAIERGLALDLRAFDVAEIVQQAIMMAGVAAERKTISIAEPLLSRSVRVIGDPGRVLQILVNLLGNAVKFTPAGGHIDVRVSAEHMVRISVNDTGPGIAAVDRERIFEKFNRLNSAEEGKGLGLHISRHLAEMMGGRLTAHENMPSGARLLLELPAAPG